MIDNVKAKIQDNLEASNTTDNVKAKIQGNMESSDTTGNIVDSCTSVRRGISIFDGGFEVQHCWRFPIFDSDPAKGEEAFLLTQSRQRRASPRARSQ